MFKSQVAKYLNKDTIVIADSLNYIKGYRYELHCIAKASSTLSIVLQVLGKFTSVSNDPSTAKRHSSNSFPFELLNEYESRMEEPNEKSKQLFR